MTGPANMFFSIGGRTYASDANGNIGTVLIDDVAGLIRSGCAVA